jgi:hypothetical protein
MAHPVAVDPHDRRRSPSQRRTSPSHQLRRTPGEKQRPRNYKPPGQTVNTADSARTMSGALVSHEARFPVSAAGEANGSALAGEALSRARVHCRTAGGSFNGTHLGVALLE